MKKLSSILMTGAISVVLSVGISGCGNPPQPYNYKMSKKYRSISDYENQQLLNIVIDRKSKIKYKSSNGCIMHTNNWYKEGYSFKYRENMKNCFKINNSIISRIDNSSCSSDHSRSYQKCNYIASGLENYTTFINDLQNNVLAKELNTEMINYQKFITLYNEADKQRKDKIAKVKTSLLDNTKVL